MRSGDRVIQAPERCLDDVAIAYDARRPPIPPPRESDRHTHIIHSTFDLKYSSHENTMQIDISAVCVHKGLIGLDREQFLKLLFCKSNLFFVRWYETRSNLQALTWN